MRIYYYRAFPSQPIRMLERARNTGNAPVWMIYRCLWLVKSVYSVKIHIRYVYIHVTQCIDRRPFEQLSFLSLYFPLIFYSLLCRTGDFIVRTLICKENCVSFVVWFYRYIFLGSEHFVFHPQVNKQSHEIKCLKSLINVAQSNWQRIIISSLLKVSAWQITPTYRKGKIWTWSIGRFLDR